MVALAGFEDVSAGHGKEVGEGKELSPPNPFWNDAG